MTSIVSTHGRVSAVFAVLCLSLLPTSLLAQAQKIAVVDLDRVVLQSPAGQALAQRLEKLRDQTQAELEARSQKIDQLRNSVAGKSFDEQREIQKQIEDEQIAGRRAQENAQREAKKLQDGELVRIQEQLRPVFEKLRQEQGFDLILNNTAGVVILAGESVDLTQQVLDSLKSQ